MNADYIITQLEKNISVFRELLFDVHEATDQTTGMGN